MTVKELKAMVPEMSTIRIVDEIGNGLDLNENAYVTKEYDDREIIRMYGERYKWIPAVGITVVLKEFKAMTEVEAREKAQKMVLESYSLPVIIIECNKRYIPTRNRRREDMEEDLINAMTKEFMKL